VTQDPDSRFGEPHVAVLIAREDLYKYNGYVLDS
jgi:hypothetical protein